MDKKTKAILATYSFKELERVVNIIPAPLYWQNTDGVVLGVNDIACLKIGGPDIQEIRNKVIGKRHEDFYPDYVARQLNENNRQVLESGQTIEFEEKVENVVTGQVQYYAAVRAPWRDDEGNIIGIIGTSIEITDKKEKERLALENEHLKLVNETQRLVTQEQEKFSMLAHKVAHDIRSPLTALTSMLSQCNELPEDKQAVLRRSANNAHEIVQNLASYYKKRADTDAWEVESRQDLLISECLTEVFNEKKYQYLNHPVDFELEITEVGKTAHIDAQSTQLRRALSNLLNNAIDALPDTRHGVITLILDATANAVSISISDNGLGMTSDTLEKIKNRTRFTENKSHGHGLGLQQVWDMLEYNRGKMTVESTPDQGTLVRLTFPRSTPAKWIVQELVLRPDAILLILDDETLIQRAWEIRLAPLLRRNRLALRVEYFDQGEAVLAFIQTLTTEERARLVLLADYELRYQTRNGLQVITESQIGNAILITAHSSNAEVRKAALDLGIRLLPKQLLADVPVLIEGGLGCV